MITIDTYTAAWDDAMRPLAPEVGEMVRVREPCDEREWFAFRSVLDSAGLTLDWIDWKPRGRWNKYLVEIDREREMELRELEERGAE